MQTVYTADGEPVELESVDAREYIATGRWFAEPPEIVKTRRGNRALQAAQDAEAEQAAALAAAEALQAGR